MSFANFKAYKSLKISILIFITYAYGGRARVFCIKYTNFRFLQISYTYNFLGIPKALIYLCTIELTSVLFTFICDDIVYFAFYPYIITMDEIKADAQKIHEEHPEKFCDKYSYKGYGMI